MGLDFGLARIGVSLSDDTKFLASPFETYSRMSLEKDINHIADIATKNKVDQIVCGLPMNMQGEEQQIAGSTRDFMSKLETKLNIKIEYVDERLSSIMAEEMLKETERDWRKRKQKLDAVAASIILQDYLDSK